MLNFCFLNPKRHILVRVPASIVLFCVKIGSGALAVERWKDPEKRSQVNIFDVHTGKNPLRDRD